MAPWVRQLISAATAFAPAVKDGFSNATLNLVRTNMLSVADASWEMGTAAESLLELSSPELSVFNNSAFPPPRRLPHSINATDVIQIANKTLENKRTDSKPLIDGQGSAADPASLGVTMLIANWTRSDLTDTRYSFAAEQQLDYLLNDAPRTSSGAISHRADEAQLWADYIYMVPPFIAYYGSLKGGDEGSELLQEAFDQISLYRDALRDDNGLWRHVTLGSWQDNTHWATGNAWAAAGMLRVLQTLNRTDAAEDFKDQQSNLTDWIQEITSTAWSFQTENGTLHNVIDDPQTFTDTASTALLASVSYRMAQFTKDDSQIESANKAFELIKDSVTPDGWLSQTVDPITFSTPSKPGEHSPEGQAFAVLLQSAWRDYTAFVKDSEKKTTKSGKNGPLSDDLTTL